MLEASRAERFAAGRGQRLRLFWPIAALYAVLALAATWPLARSIDRSLPLGSGDAATVPLVSAWTLWWTFDRLGHGLSGYWEAPIFHPTRGAFAFSEPMPLAGLLSAPLLGAGASPALAHNLFLLLALWSNGLLGFALARALRCSVLASAAAGAVMLLLPYVHHQVGVLALVPLAGVLSTLLAVLRCARRPGALRGALVGLAFAGAFLLCAQYALLLALGLLLSAPWLLRRSAFGAGGARAVAAAALVSAVLIAPVALPQRAATSSHHFERSLERAESGSASARAWWRTPWPELVPLPGLQVASPPYQRSLFPGSVRLALALVGVAWGVRSRGRRRATAFLIALGTAGVLLSVLAHVELGRLSPYAIARAVVPGLAQIRSPWRAGLLLQIAVALLLAQGLQALWLARPSVRGRLPLSARSVRALRLSTALAGLLAIVELWPSSYALAQVPQRREFQPWISWIEAHVPPSAPIAYLPFPDDSRVQSYEQTARFMYLSAFHGRPMVNGYSSYFPPSYDELVSRMRRRGGEVDVAALEAFGVATVVVSSPRPDDPLMPSSWRRLWRDARLGLEVYRRHASAPR